MSGNELLQLSSHDRILLAAKRLFAQNGYENTSTVAIAREAGTSESQLMKHFGSKLGLLMAVFEWGWIGISERSRAINYSSPADRLIAVLQAITMSSKTIPNSKYWRCWKPVASARTVIKSS